MRNNMEMADSDQSLSAKVYFHESRLLWTESVQFRGFQRQLEIPFK